MLLHVIYAFRSAPIPVFNDLQNRINRIASSRTKYNYCAYSDVHCKLNIACVMLASPSMRCHRSVQLLLLLLGLCLSPAPSTNALSLYGDDVTAPDGELSPANIAPVPTPPPPRRDSLGVSETLNSHHGQLIPSFSSLSATATSAAVTLRSGPPLFVGSDGAQRFFDRLHGFVEEKPVVQQYRRAGSNGNDHGDHDSPTVSATIRTTTKADAQNGNDGRSAAADDDDDGNDDKAREYKAQQTSAASTFDPNDTAKNWILRQATRTRKQALSPSSAVEKIAISGAEARQSFVSLSERIMGQLAAGNPWVNWTQSTGPVVVTNVDNLPIGQFPFVVVQATQPPVIVTAEQKPPKRGWFGFQRPWNNRIYGDGTESKFPPLLEHVVQRIQNYWSVFKYEDQSRPYVGQLGQTVMDSTEASTPMAGSTETVTFQDELITESSAINGIEIDLVTSTLADDSTSGENDVEGNTSTETAFINTEHNNEIIETSEKETRRNDKIIRINMSINNV